MTQHTKVSSLISSLTSRSSFYQRQSTVTICVDLGPPAIICPRDRCGGRVINVEVDGLLDLALDLRCSDQLGTSPSQPTTESHHLSVSIGNRPLGSNVNPVDNNGQPQNANQDPVSSQPPRFGLGTTGNQVPNNNLPLNPTAGLDGSQRQNPDGDENGGASGQGGLGSLFGGNTGPTFLGLPGLDANPGDNIDHDGGGGPTGLISGIKATLHLGGGPSLSRSSPTSQISGSGTSNTSGNGDGNGNGSPTQAHNQPNGDPAFGDNQGLNGTPDTNSNGFQGDDTPNSNDNGSQGDSSQPTVDAGNGGTDDGPFDGDSGVRFGGSTGPTFLGFPGPKGTKDGGTGGISATVSTSLLEHDSPASSASPPGTSRNGVENRPDNSNGSGDISGPSHGGGDAFDPNDNRPAFAGHFPQGSSDGPSDSPQLAGLPHDSRPAGFGDSLPDGSPGDSGSGTPHSNGRILDGPDHPSNDDSPSNDAHPDHWHPLNDDPPLGEDPSADPFNGSSPSNDGHLSHPHDDSQVGHDHPDHPRHHSQFGDGNPNPLFNGDSHFGDENLNQPHDDDTQIENPGHSHNDVPHFGDNHFDHPFNKDSQSGGDHLDRSGEEDPHFGNNRSDHPFDSRFDGRLPDHFRDNTHEHPDRPFHEHSHEHSHVGGNHLDHFRDKDVHDHSSDEDRLLHLSDNHFSHPANEGSESHDRLGNHFNDGSYFDGDDSNGRPFKNNPFFGDNDPNSHATRIDGGDSDDVHSDGGTHFGEDRSHDDPQDSPPGDGPYDGPRFGHHQHRPHQMSVDDWQPDGSHFVDPLSDSSRHNEPLPPRFAPFGPGPVKHPYHSHDEPVGSKDERMSHSYVSHDPKNSHHPHCIYPCRCA